ncbi:MAG: PAS domain-containing protein, partial [SAR324 cluster bacterium]|nr:PAS domain-containing protein [SAR324 cluster bacterium]
NKQLRIWVAGCSTGEEAYSLAMLCRECMEELNVFLDVKIFATDVDKDAITIAGTGAYPESITADLSPELITKYFQKRDENYVVTRKIREMVVFAQHNLIKDPPFTNMDLISCRNLLIYLQPVLQKKVFQLFNFSLNAHGILLLGPSESLGDMADFFEAVDHKWKIYLSRGRSKYLTQMSELPHVVEKRNGYPTSVKQSDYEQDRFLQRFLEFIAQDYQPFAVVVNEHMELVFVLNDQNHFLKYPFGKTSQEINKVIIDELKIPISTGLQKAFSSNETLRYNSVRIYSGNTPLSVDIRICPLPEKRNRERLVGIFISESKQPVTSEMLPEKNTFDVSKESEQRILDLEHELQFTRENLQATVEELETSNEELQATNEELLASNEELQSTNEELQSVNEELYTVNAELQQKIIEMTQLNNDMDNLLKNRDVGMLFLGPDLKIRKFTQEINRIFQVIDSDIGRPITHLNHRLIKVNPLAWIQEVLDNDTSIEQEVINDQQHWYLLKINPYYEDGEPLGVVISAIDIQSLKLTQQELEQEKRRLDLSQELVGIGSWELDLQSELIQCFDLAFEILDHPRSVPLTLDEFISKAHPDDQESLSRFIREAAVKESDEILEHRLVKKGETLLVREKLRVIKNHQGEPSGILGVIQDVNSGMVQCPLGNNQSCSIIR